MSFTLWLHKKKLENFIFSLGFIFAIMAYSFWEPISNVLKLEGEESYKVYYICISISFFFYTFAYFLSKYNKWRWFPMFVSLICLSRVSQEIFYPEAALEYDWLEYFYFTLTIFIVFFSYVKYQRKKYEDGRSRIKKDS